MPESNRRARTATQTLPPGQALEAAVEGPDPTGGDRPVVDVDPLPEAPDGNLIEAARYALEIGKARRKRRGAIRLLEEEIRERVGILDGVLGTLGKQVRQAGLRDAAFAEENAALDEAEGLRTKAEHASGELATRKAEENEKYEKIHQELQVMAEKRERAAEDARRRLDEVESRRRALKDRRREIEKAQRQLLKSAEVREEQASKEELGDKRSLLRKSAQDLRDEAEKMNVSRDDVDRKLAALDRPLAEATGVYEAARAERDAARRALEDARAGHAQRLTELESEQGRKSKELVQAEAEIQRRLVTLGTLANLHRVQRSDFLPLYERIDELKAAVSVREETIERLRAERGAYDRGAFVRGVAVLAAGAAVVITVVSVIIALL